MTAGNQKLPRVVITGVGVVSPVGTGNVPFWNNLLSGKSGIGFLRAFPHENLPCKLAAEIEDFDPRKYLHQRKALKLMSRDIQLGVGAAAIAMQEARLARGQVDPERLGVIFGAGRISSTPQELAAAAKFCAKDDNFSFDNFGEECLDQISPLWLLRQLPNMPACHVAIENDARGPNNTITSREASALLALSEAMNTIQRGAADAMIVGACGSDVHPVDISRLTLFENLSRKDDPTKACRPFDFNRDGCILGEGAAAFIVESYDFARARGADIFAEIVSVGAGCDGFGYENGAGGTGLVRSIQSALRKAEILPDEIGHINAHGKATLRDDLVEARAYHGSLGQAAETIPVTGLKGYFGTFDAGSGAVELAASVLALRHGVLPFTLNYETPDPELRLNVIHHEPLPLHNRTAMSVNRTAIGQSAAAIIRAV